MEGEGVATCDSFEGPAIPLNPDSTQIFSLMRLLPIVFIGKTHLEIVAQRTFKWYYVLKTNSLLGGAR